MDSSKNDKLSFGWLTSTYAWYVDSLELKLQMLVNGFGFSWLNQTLIEERQLPLKPRALVNDKIRYHDLYLTHRHASDISYAKEVLINIFKSKSNVSNYNDAPYLSNQK